MSKKDEYFAKSQIKKWDAEVDKLNAKAKQMSAEARAKYDEQLSAMRASRNCRLQEIAGIAHGQWSAWQQMEAGVDAAWTSMRKALDKASSQFKK
jgi:hypothetical protein